MTVQVVSNWSLSEPFKGVLSSYQMPQSCPGTYFLRKASPKTTIKNSKLMLTQEPLIMIFHLRGACSPPGAPVLHSTMAPLPFPSLPLDFSIPLPKSRLCVCVGGETSQTSHNPQLVFQKHTGLYFDNQTPVAAGTASNPTRS